MTGKRRIGAPLRPDPSLSHGQRRRSHGVRSKAVAKASRGVGGPGRGQRPWMRGDSDKARPIPPASLLLSRWPLAHRWSRDSIRAWGGRGCCGCPGIQAWARAGRRDRQFRACHRTVRGRHTGQRSRSTRRPAPRLFSPALMLASVPISALSAGICAAGSTELPYGASPAGPFAPRGGPTADARAIAYTIEAQIVGHVQRLIKRPQHAQSLQDAPINCDGSCPTPLSHGVLRVDDRRAVSDIIYVIRNGEGRA